MRRFWRGLVIFLFGGVLGTAFGVALRASEAAWIAADFPGDGAAIGAIADRAAKT